MNLFNNQYDLNVTMMEDADEVLVDFLDSVFKILPQEMLEDIKAGEGDGCTYQGNGIFNLNQTPEKLEITRYQNMYDPMVKLTLLNFNIKNIKRGQLTPFAYLTVKNQTTDPHDKKYVFMVEKVMERNQDNYYGHVSFQIKEYQEKEKEYSGKLKKYPMKSLAFLKDLSSMASQEQ